MEKIKKILAYLETLTLVEAAELVEKIEQIYGIDVSSPTSSIKSDRIVNDTRIEEVEEKTKFDLFLVDVPVDKKISILKVVRTITGLGLKEVKTLVESAPKIIQASIDKESAENGKKKLEEVGAVVEIK